MCAICTDIVASKEFSMTSTTMRTAHPTLSLRLLAGGLVAGMVMGMWQMILEAVLPSGAGFWAPLVYIAATILRSLQTVATPAPFHLLGVILGLMGHMMNSVIFGLIFAVLIAPRLRSLVRQIIAGMVYGVAIYLVMWFVLVPLIDPVMLHLNSLVFLLGHLMYGGVLGLVNHWATTRT